MPQGAEGLQNIPIYNHCASLTPPQVSSYESTQRAAILGWVALDRADDARYVRFDKCTA